MMSKWLWYLVAGLGAWYWWNSVRCKEIARGAGAQACQRANVQFLDDSVVCTRIRLKRNSQGRVQLLRLYLFEFTSDGSQRYQGRISLLGQRILHIDMDAHRLPTEES